MRGTREVHRQRREVGLVLVEGVSVRRLTASKLGLAIHCLHWLRDEAEWSDKTSWSAQIGKAFHARADEITRGVTVTDKFKLTARQYELVENMVSQWRLWRSGLAMAPDLFWVSEIGFAYDPETGRARTLEMKHERDYSQAKPHEICGTADFVVPADDKPAWVGDYKTGRGWVPDARDNMQLRGLALMLAREEGVSTVRASVVRVSEIGCYAPEPAVFDAFELDVIEDELRGIHEKRRLGVYDPNPGEHCRFCPHKSACVANQKGFV